MQSVGMNTLKLTEILTKMLNKGYSQRCLEEFISIFLKICTFLKGTLSIITKAVNKAKMIWIPNKRHHYQNKVEEMVFKCFCSGLVCSWE